MSLKVFRNILRLVPPIIGIGKLKVQFAFTLMISASELTIMFVEGCFVKLLLDSISFVFKRDKWVSILKFNYKLIYVCKKRCK